MMWQVMNVYRSCLYLELNAWLKKELIAKEQREQEAPQNVGSIMLEQLVSSKIKREPNVLLNLQQDGIAKKSCDLPWSKFSKNTLQWYRHGNKPNPWVISPRWAKEGGLRVFSWSLWEAYWEVSWLLWFDILDEPRHYFKILHLWGGSQTSGLEEVKMLNDVRKVVLSYQGKSVIKSKWIYKRSSFLLTIRVVWSSQKILYSITSRITSRGSITMSRTCCNMLCQVDSLLMCWLSLCRSLSTSKTSLELLTMSLLLRESVKDSVAARPILKEDGTLVS